MVRREKRWWDSPAATTSLAGLLGLIGVVVGNNIHVQGLTFGGTEHDYPQVKETPRGAICFWHGNKPAGFRLIRRRQDGTWLEKQPDGKEYHHKEIGHVIRGPWHGAITDRIEHPPEEPWSVQLFIPDEGSHDILLYRADKATPWEYVSILASSTANCPRLADRPERADQPLTTLGR